MNQIQYNTEGMIIAAFIILLILSCGCIIYLNNRGRTKMLKEGMPLAQGDLHYSHLSPVTVNLRYKSSRSI